MIAKLICKLLGHKRGVRTIIEQPSYKTAGVTVNQLLQGYRCPRCSATWTRKVRA